MPDLTSWRSRNTRPELGKCLFSFAVIADTHVDREGEPSSSPFPVNQLSNARTRYCIEDIKRLDADLDDLSPKFVLHMGDVIHPVPSMPSYAAAAADFYDIVDGLDVPLHLIPGNHDVGDKPVDWAPAGVVRDDFLALWEKHFGDQYHAFDHGDIRFVMINAQIINSGLETEHQQRDWLEKELADHANGRVMLCTHYPPYLTSPSETENYDNIGEPGRSWILDLLERQNIEALFAGHVHHYWYNRFADTDCYLLPSTSFTRQDYSEMFRVPPPPDMQDGRNDVAKVGYFIVFVYENGHVCHLRRTDGLMLEKGEHLPTCEPRIASFHTREMGDISIGFDLRHPWAELTEIAPSGALDEFHRKKMRNDYPLLSLWDMGVRKLRIPLQDFEVADVRERIRAMVHQGHKFTVISQGIPNAEYQQLLVDNGDLIERWEVALPLSKLQDATPALRGIRDKATFPIFLAKLRTKNDIVKQGEPYFHLITYGFIPEYADEIAALESDEITGEIFSGYAFRIGRFENLSDRLAEIAALTDKTGIRRSATIFMADNNPALHQCDDLANANRMAEGLFAATQFPKLDVFIDTYMDLDRGHSVRNGVIDRHCNPRLGLHVIKTLHSLVSWLPMDANDLNAGEADGGRWGLKIGDDFAHALVMPNAKVRDFALPMRLKGQSNPGTAQAVDLSTGEISDVAWRPIDAGEISVKFPAEITSPIFVSFKF